MVTMVTVIVFLNGEKAWKSSFPAAHFLASCKCKSNFWNSNKVIVFVSSFLCVCLLLVSLCDRVLGLYAYTDLLQDSTNTDSSLKPGVNYSIHRIAVNIQKELARIEATDYSSSYAFHRDISKLMGSFFDAHTTYVTPYTAIHFALPFIFGSAVVNGEQRLTVDRVSGGTFPAYYELHKGPPFINFDKFSSVFPQLLGLQPENLVTTINGIPAMNYTRSFADQAGTYKSAGARFNAFLSTPAYSTYRQIKTTVPVYFKY